MKTKQENAMSNIESGKLKLNLGILRYVPTNEPDRYPELF